MVVKKVKLIEKIKSWFNRGGVAVSMGKTYRSILDHPKINMDKKEYKRITENLRIYRGEYPNIKYLNSRGATKERPYMSLNMMKSVAETLADVVFNEKCKIEIDILEANEFITRTFNENNFIKNFSKYLEPMFALGGLAVRPYSDANDDYKIKFSWVQANAFFPLESNTNQINECALATTTTIENKETYYYTLLEFHEWLNGEYVITNELYKSDRSGVLGKEVPLSSLAIYQDLSRQSAIRNLSRPNFCYLKPNTFNNLNPQSSLGLGLTDNCKDTLTQISDTYDAFHWEIKMGERKVVVTDGMLKTRLDENGNPIQTFDDKTNIFLAVRGEINDKSLVQDITLDIRSKQYIESINNFIRTLEMQTKISDGTFSFNGDGVQKTATEVIAENSMTFRTRSKQLIEVENFLKNLIISILELAQATTNADGSRLYTGNIPTLEDIGVNFDDGAFTDKTTKLEHYSKAVKSGFMPRIEAIQRAMQVPEETAR